MSKAGYEAKLKAKVTKGTTDNKIAPMAQVTDDGEDKILPGVTEEKGTKPTPNSDDAKKANVGDDKKIDGVSLDEVTAAVKAAVADEMMPLKKAVADVTKRQDSLERVVDDKMGRTSKVVTDVQKQVNGLAKSVVDQQKQITEQKEALEKALEAMKAVKASAPAPVAQPAPTYTFPTRVAKTDEGVDGINVLKAEKLVIEHATFQQTS